ncbi:MAG TPA: hypothetical protein VMR02_05085 [Terracidiphilus sp.]|jgi:hypothetical protein|nr:hypothetical protein [Terracidiphilus sp.]
MFKLIETWQNDSRETGQGVRMLYSQPSFKNSIMSAGSRIMLVYMAPHGFVPVGCRPGTAAQAPPSANRQSAKNYRYSNPHVDSHQHDTVI